MPLKNVAAEKYEFGEGSREVSPCRPLLAILDLWDHATYACARPSPNLLLSGLRAGGLVSIYITTTSQGRLDLLKISTPARSRPNGLSPALALVEITHVLTSYVIEITGLQSG